MSPLHESRWPLRFVVVAILALGSGCNAPDPAELYNPTRMEVTHSRSTSGVQGFIDTVTVRLSGTHSGYVHFQFLRGHGYVRKVGSPPSMNSLEAVERTNAEGVLRMIASPTDIGEVHLRIHALGDTAQVTVIYTTVAE